MPINLTEVTEVRNMARSLSSLISNASDTEIDSAIQKHAEPRVRLYLMAATDGSGAHIFYSDLEDLSTNATAVEALVDQVFQEPTVKSSLLRVMAAFSAAWVINARVGIIESQQRIAYALEKQALGDLDRLTKSPIIKTAVAQAISKMREGLNFATTLMIAPDIDPATKNTAKKTVTPYSGAQLPYASATKAGRARIWINGESINVDVAAGDTAVTVVQKLVNQFNSASASGVSAFNCNLAPSEVPTSSSTRPVSTTDSTTGITTSEAYTYEYEAAKISILPKNYDNVLDIAVATLFLESPKESSPSEYTPGIKGLLYGTASAASQLTFKGPHSIAIDLKTGRTSVIEDTTSTSKLSDMLFFEGTSTAAGNLVYKITGGKIISPVSRTVAVPLGSDALKVIEILSADLTGIAQLESTGLLGAIRPSTQITLNGSPISAPGIEFVAFKLSDQETKILFTLESVPEGITFAVIPPSRAVSGEFDSRPKTVVIDFTMVRVSKTLDSSSGTGGQAVGGVSVVTHNPTPGLKSILDKLKRLQDGMY